MGEIITRWKNLEELHAENRLFDTYLRTRKEYVAGARSLVRGEIFTNELQRLYQAERAAFAAYRQFTE